MGCVVCFFFFAFPKQTYNAGGPGGGREGGSGEKGGGETSNEID